MVKPGKSLRSLWRWSLFFWFGQILVILLAWRFLPPELPLFYSQPWGENQLATPFGLLLLPLLGLLVLALNTGLLFFISQEEKLSQQILTTSALVFNFLSLVTLIQIVRLLI